MGAHKIYCSLDDLNEVFYFDEHITLHNIIDQFCDVVLDIENDELIAMLANNPLLKLLFKRDTAGVIGDKKKFVALENGEYGTFLNDILLLDKEKNVEKIREDFGILALHNDEDDFLQGQNLHFGYSINVEKECKFGCWGDVFLDKKINPINSAILVDNFLWGSVVDFNKENQENIYPIFEHIIPKKLKVPFRLVIIIQNKDGRFNPDNSKDKINKLSRNLSKISGIDVEVGLITQTDTKIFHERVIITNYHYIYSDKGFITFKDNRIYNPTHGDRNWVFKDIDNYVGEIRKHRHLNIIRNVKEAIRFSNEVNSDAIFNLGEINNPILN